MSPATSLNIAADTAATTGNLIGNCPATAVVTRWESEFDDHCAKVFYPPVVAWEKLSPTRAIW